MSILAGLTSSPIHRLKRTWELLSSKSFQCLESLQATMNSSKNFATYREELHTVKPPLIPFLGKNIISNVIFFCLLILFFLFLFN